MREAPPAVATVYLQEFKAYVRTNHNRFRKCQENGKQRHGVADVDCSSESDGGGQDHGEDKFMREVDAYFKYCNGRWWSPAIEHWCDDPACCPEGRPSTIRRRQRSRSPSGPVSAGWLATSGHDWGLSWIGCCSGHPLTASLGVACGGLASMQAGRRRTSLQASKGRLGLCSDARQEVQGFLPNASLALLLSL